MLVGQKRTLRGFVATSIDRDVSIAEFTGPHGALLEITVPRDLPGTWIAGAGDPKLRYQGELLFGSDLRLRIVAVRHEGDLTVLSCEVIS